MNGDDQAPPAARLAERVALRLKDLDMSERQASMLATGRPDTLRYIRTRGVMPSASKLIQISRVLQADPSYLLGYTDNIDSGEIKTISDGLNLMSPGLIEKILNPSDDDNRDRERVFVSNCGPLCYEIFQNSAGVPQIIQMHVLKSKSIDEFPLPLSLHKGSFRGLVNPDSSIDPMFKKGDLLLLEEAIEIKPGHTYAIHLVKSNSPKNRPGLAFTIKQVVHTSDFDVTVEQLNPPHVFAIARANISSFSRVVKYSELLVPDGIYAANIP